jgi:hypothetical protein
MLLKEISLLTHGSTGRYNRDYGSIVNPQPATRRGIMVNAIVAPITRLTIIRRNGKSYFYYRSFIGGHYIRKYPNGKQISDAPSSKKNRRSVLERDGLKCTNCGSTRNIDIHHKDGKSYRRAQSDANNKLENLITLCHKCHQRQHRGIIKRHLEIITRRNTGETFNSIAISMGVSRQRIHQIYAYQN